MNLDSLLVRNRCWQPLFPPKRHWIASQIIRDTHKRDTRDSRIDNDKRRGQVDLSKVSLYYVSSSSTSSLLERVCVLETDVVWIESQDGIDFPLWLAFHCLLLICVLPVLSCSEIWVDPRSWGSDQQSDRQRCYAYIITLHGITLFTDNRKTCHDSCIRDQIINFFLVLYFLFWSVVHRLSNFYYKWGWRKRISINDERREEEE